MPFATSASISAWSCRTDRGDALDVLGRRGQRARTDRTTRTSTARPRAGTGSARRTRSGARCPTGAAALRDCRRRRGQLAHARAGVARAMAEDDRRGGGRICEEHEKFETCDPVTDWSRFQDLEARAARLTHRARPGPGLDKSGFTDRASRRHRPSTGGMNAWFRVNATLARVFSVVRTRRGPRGRRRERRARVVALRRLGAEAVVVLAPHGELRDEHARARERTPSRSARSTASAPRSTFECRSSTVESAHAATPSRRSCAARRRA